MLKFRKIKEPLAPPLPNMSLREYAEFSEFCLKNNPEITPENCLQRDSGERNIKEPFRLEPETVR